MGAWGPAIFSDDTACDIRSDYRELLEDGVDPEEATRRVVSEYQHLGEDEVHILWLALAAAQSALGRLEESVKAEALRVIDGEVGLQLWAEAGAGELARRKAALTKLRKTLTGPQKPPSKVRRPWSHVTDLAPGDVLVRSPLRELFRSPLGRSRASERELLRLILGGFEVVLPVGKVSGVVDVGR